MHDKTEAEIRREALLEGAAELRRMERERVPFRDPIPDIIDGAKRLEEMADE